jgi:hypothetical protein
VLNELVLLSSFSIVLRGIGYWPSAIDHAICA